MSAVACYSSGLFGFMAFKTLDKNSMGLGSYDDGVVERDRNRFAAESR